MKKPCEIDQNLKRGENKKHFNIKFNDDTSHEEVVYQFVTGLVNLGFAPEQEILENIVELCKDES